MSECFGPNRGSYKEGQDVQRNNGRNTGSKTERASFSRSQIVWWIFERALKSCRILRIIKKGWWIVHTSENCCGIIWTEGRNHSWSVWRWCSGHACVCVGNIQVLQKDQRFKWVSDVYTLLCPRTEPVCCWCERRGCWSEKYVWCCEQIAFVYLSIIKKTFGFLKVFRRNLKICLQ